jgi:hypothetical protein
MNAVGGISQLAEIKKEIPKIMKSASFNSGYTYKEFDSKLDEVAAVSIGGLVAGKVLAKTGLLAIIAKFGKVIVLGAVAAGAWVINLFRRRKNTDDEVGESEDTNANSNYSSESNHSATDTNQDIDSTHEHDNSPPSDEASSHNNTTEK